MLFFGLTGAASTPFQGGTLCVAGPKIRTPFQNSGGSGACGGSFDIDFNAYLQTLVGVSIGAGSHVWAQYWSRDPGAVAGGNLTDAVHFQLWP
jgi:hypothetical protein